MELRQLRYFAAVARHRHFTRAADELHVTQPALSQQVRALERELGVALLHRDARGVALTPAGEDLLARADAILAETARARAAMDEHAGLLRGVVRVGADGIAALALPPVLAAFHRAHAGIRIALRQGATAEVAGLARTGAVDLAVVSLPTEEVAGGGAEGGTLAGGAGRTPAARGGTGGGGAAAAIPLAPEPLHAIVAPGDPLARAGELALWELRERPFVLPEPGTGLRAAVAAACMAAGFSPVPLFEVGEPSAVRHLVHEGLGVSLVPAGWLRQPGPEVGVARLAAPVPTHRAVLLAAAGAASPAGELLHARIVAALGAPASEDG